MISTSIRLALPPAAQRARRRRRLNRSARVGGEHALEPRVLLSDVSVPQYRYDNSNTGQNLQETTLTTSNVNPTDFGKLYQYPVDGYVYAQPLYMANLAIPGQGTHDLVFVATEHDSVYAFDANGNDGVNGTPLWQDSFINPAAGITTVSSSDVNSGDIQPEIGITAAPVIDPNTNVMYVISKTKNVVNGTEHFVQELHALSVTTGAEMYNGPVVIADTTMNPDGSYTYNSGPWVYGNGDGSINGVVNFNALRQNDRPQLVLNNGTVYLAFASHGDNGPYHGWVLGYNETSLALTGVLNTTPNGGLGGIWGAGEGLAVDSQGYMYFVTGNGTFDTTLTSTPPGFQAGFPAYGDYGDSVVKIAVDTTTNPSNQGPNGWGLKVVDYFTPYDQQSLYDNDADFGSGGPMLLPATSTGPQVVLACGKEGSIFVLNTATGSMGEFNPNANVVYQELPYEIGGVWGAPSYFNGSVYYGGAGDYIKAFSLNSNNTLNTPPTSNSPEAFGYPGPTSNLSANGSSNGIDWAIDNTAYASPGPAVLYAYDASNLGNELYNTNDAAGARDQAGVAVKFTVPLITNGQVFLGNAYALTIYGLLAGAVAPAAPTNLQANAISNSQVTLTWQNNSANETGFTIERSTDRVHFTSVATIGAYLNTYTVGGLASSMKYYFEVVAANSVGSATSNIASATTLKAPFPTGWSDTDIGSPPIAGSATYKNGTFTVFGNGDDIWNTSDQFHYVYTTITGDGTIVARVDSQQNTDPWAKSGVMLRQSLDADSPYAFVFTTPGNGTDFQWRAAQGDFSTWNGNQINATAPYWVKLVRAAATFTAYASPDGKNWISLGSVTIPMSTQIYVGLAVTSHNTSELNESTFDSVSVTSATTSGYFAVEAGGGPTGTYQADEFYSGGNTAQFSAPINLSGVTDPAPQGVYQTERYGTFAYTIPNLKAGALYTVRLHFSEDYWDAPGQRIFDVAINGTQVLSNFDIFATTGGMDTAIAEQFAANADSSGQITINFYPAANSPDQNAKVDGIEIVPVQITSRLHGTRTRITAVAGQSFSGTIATFTDSDPDTLASDYIATTNWGDGTVTTSTVQVDSSGTKFDVVDSHTYANPGAYVVTVVIQTYDGAAVRVIDRANVSKPPTDGLIALGPGGGAPAALIGRNPFADRPVGSASAARAQRAGSAPAQLRAAFAVNVSVAPSRVAQAMSRGVDELAKTLLS
jgi:hypothetical protein